MTIQRRQYGSRASIKRRRKNSNFAAVLGHLHFPVFPQTTVTRKAEGTCDAANARPREPDRLEHRTPFAYTIPKTNRIRHMIRGDHLHKTYYLGRTELNVLRGVSVEFARGGLIGITGASGSGKSTLLHVLSGLDVPQRGQVFYDNEPLFEPEGSRDIPLGRDADATRAAHGHASDAGYSQLQHFEAHRNGLRNRRFGFVFQFYHLLPEFDVLENVMLPYMVGNTTAGWLTGRAAAQQRALSLLDQVGLRDRMKHRPNELSGGERQRASIARALMNEPEILFADEPTGNLDGKTGRAIFDLLRDLNQAGQTIVMVTHDRDLAKEADRIVHLVDGRIESDN